MKRFFIIWLLGTIASAFPFGFGLFFGWPSVLIWTLGVAGDSTKGTQFLIRAFGKGLISSFVGLTLLNMYHIGDIELIATSFLTVMAVPSVIAAVIFLKLFGLDNQENEDVSDSATSL